METSLRVKQTLATTTAHVHIDLRAWETSERGQQQRRRVVAEVAVACGKAEAAEDAERDVSVWKLGGRWKHRSILAREPKGERHARKDSTQQERNRPGLTNQARHLGH